MTRRIRLWRLVAVLCIGVFAIQVASGAGWMGPRQAAHPGIPLPWSAVLLAVAIFNYAAGCIADSRYQKRAARIYEMMRDEH